MIDDFLRKLTWHPEQKQDPFDRLCFFVFGLIELIDMLFTLGITSTCQISLHAAFGVVLEMDFGFDSPSQGWFVKGEILTFTSIGVG